MVILNDARRTISLVMAAVLCRRAAGSYAEPLPNLQPRRAAPGRSPRVRLARPHQTALVPVSGRAERLLEFLERASGAPPTRPERPLYLDHSFITHLAVPVLERESPSERAQPTALLWSTFNPPTVENQRQSVALRDSEIGVLPAEIGKRSRYGPRHQTPLPR